MTTNTLFDMLVNGERPPVRATFLIDPVTGLPPVSGGSTPQTAQGAVTTANPVYTPGTNQPLSLDPAGNLRTIVAPGTSVIGRVGIDQTTPGTTNRVTAGGTTPRITAQMVRPAAAVVYDPGDLIGPSATAASVVPITFTGAARVSGGSGRVTGARCVVSALAGTISLPAFDLMLFRPAAGIPFAAGAYPADNAAMLITGAAMVELIGVLQFSSTGWRNGAGGSSAAGGVIYQETGFAFRPYAPFNLASVSSANILGLMQAQNQWAPGAVVNTFDIVLDLDQD